MNREEAILLLHDMKDTYDEIHENTNYEIGHEQMTALDMAIEALTEPKTIIGIDIPYGSDKGIATIFKGNEKMVLEEAKEIMAVVRCKDCLNRYLFSCPLEYNDFNEDDDYCSWGKRRE